MIFETGGIQVRPYATGDEPGLLALFTSVFGRASTLEQWRWKLHWPHCGVDNVWLARAGGRAIFQYAGIPTRFSLDHRPATMMVSVDTMTAPEFRRRGLLTRVAAQAYAQWRSCGVPFVIGLPNQQWRSRTAALGWQPLFPLQWLVRPLRPELVLARRLGAHLIERAGFLAAPWNRYWDNRIQKDRSVSLEPAAAAGAEFDELWHALEPCWALSTVRDRQWVDWRFLKSPSRAYAVTLARRRGTPVGYAAQSLSGTPECPTAYLAELVAAPTDVGARDSLMRGALRSARRHGAQALITLAIPGTSNHDWLRRCGFFPRQSFSVRLVPLTDRLPWELMRDPTQWNLSGADFDVV